MTARELQIAIMDDLAALFKDRQYKDPEGNMVAPSIFKQQLPKRQSEEDEQPFPYIIVRLNFGNIEAHTDPHTVSVLLVIGAYDDDPANEGHDSVMEMIELIHRHYEERPIIPGTAFKFSLPFNWVLQDEESYPYFIGVASTVWNITEPRRSVTQYT